jgi:cell division protein ZapA (FtsZ GTPase activity inhibitor)
MNGECKNYKVTIFGNEYTLVSDESFESVCGVALQVDMMMREIANKTLSKDPTHIAVLAAIKTTHALLECKGNTTDIGQRHELLIKQVDQVLSMLNSCI